MTRRGASAGFDSFAVMSFAWAFAILTHQAFGALVGPSVSVLLTVAMIGVLLRPSSVPRFVAMIAIQIVTVVVGRPHATNHWVMITIANLWILMAVGILYARNHRFPTGMEIYRLATPALRLLLLVLYGFVTLHKLNWGFLDPQLSCGSTLLGWLAARVPGLPSGGLVDIIAIYGTLVIEGGLIAALLWPRSRPWALLFGTVFHVVLGVTDFYNFSGAMLAFYVLFLGEGFPARLHAMVDPLPTVQTFRAFVVRIAHHRATWPIAAAVAVAAAVVPGWVGAPAELYWKAPRTGVMAVWLTDSVSAMVVFAWVWKRSGSDGIRRVRVGLGHHLAWLPLVLFTLVGFSPYLGLRTEASYAMFSNLQTEGDQWNHLFMPRRMRIFDFQNDLVTVVASSDPHLQAVADRGERSVYFEFQRYTSERPDISVTYRHRSVERFVEKVADDPELSRPPNPVLAKLLWFRPVPSPENNTCRH